jgi:hypothetical protein
VNIDHYRQPGTKLYFEYHCWESLQSGDAELWLRSHSLVEVLGCMNNDDYGHMTFDQRCYEACQLVYKIKFEDGFIGEAFEDELLDSPDEYERPEPPKRSEAT